MELVLRFLFGGALVVLFSAAGEVLRPKSFAGIFGAAPTIAIVSLVLAHRAHGAPYVATETATMLLGAIALSSYGAASIAVLRRSSWKPWIGALTLWGEWAAVAFAAWAVVAR